MNTHFFTKKLNYRFIPCNETICSGIYFSREHPFQSVQLTKILSTHIFSHLSVLCKTKYIHSLENGKSGGKSRINIVVVLIYGCDITVFLFAHLQLYIYEGQASEPGRILPFSDLGTSNKLPNVSKFPVPHF